MSVHVPCTVSRLLTISTSIIVTCSNINELGRKDEKTHGISAKS